MDRLGGTGRHLQSGTRNNGNPATESLRILGSRGVSLNIEHYVFRGSLSGSQGQKEELGVTLGIFSGSQGHDKALRVH